MMNIERIRNLREDNDLTQTDIARMLNISQRAYSHYESGNRKLPLDVIVSLADYYDCSVDYLLYRTDKKELNR